jgi:GNAT superfamily N-acetyltransferase
LLIHITGASGAGTSTLGAALADALGGRHVEADDHYWWPTDPPYTHKRAPPERLAGLLAVLDAHPTAVLAGSVVGWGAALEDRFDLVVFLTLDAALRVERLRQRETARLGHADPAFLAWAAQYDEGPVAGRSLHKHRAWLAERSCPVLELHGDLSVEARLAAVLARVATLPAATPPTEGPGHRTGARHRVRLRPATAADAPRVAALLIDTRRSFMPYAPSAHTDEEVHAWVAGELVPGGGVTVATVEHTVVAAMAVDDQGGGWIHQMAVDPHWVGQGIGSVLLRHALETLPRPVRLYTFQANTGARRFYERHGFVAIAFSDGQANEEHCPDVLYERPAH